MIEPGLKIGHYVVGERIATSVDTEIFELTHELFGATHAVKVQRKLDKSVRDALLHEARVQATVRHPNILRVTDFVEHEGQLGLVMDRMHGSTLKDWLAEHDMPLATAMVVFAGIVKGVQAAHRLDIVHRMLSPDKVLVDPQSVVPRVIDFGMSKELDPSLDVDMSMSLMFPFLGVPGYTAPEQSLYAAGAQIESDMFSLGCVLYEMVCGKPAFPTDDPVMAREMTMTGHYEKPSVARPGLVPFVERVIVDLLAPEPEDRIKDCGTLLRKLKVADDTQA